MGRYFVRVVNQELLPDGKPWVYVDDHNDAYFFVGPNGCELTPEALAHCFAKVQEVYARPSIAAG